MLGLLLKPSTCTCLCYHWRPVPACVLSSAYVTQSDGCLAHRDMYVRTVAKSLKNVFLASARARIHVCNWFRAFTSWSHNTSTRHVHRTVQTSNYACLNECHQRLFFLVKWKQLVTQKQLCETQVKIPPTVSSDMPAWLHTCGKPESISIMETVTKAGNICTRFWAKQPRNTAEKSSGRVQKMYIATKN